MLSTGWSVGKVALFQLVSAFTAFIGLYVGITISQVSSETQQWIFIVATAMFLYVALADVVRFSQGRRAKVIWGAPASFPFLPFPSLPFPLLFLPSLPSFPLPSFSFPLEVGPLIAARRSGERFSSPSGSGRSPASKRSLVNLRQK